MAAMSTAIISSLRLSFSRINDDDFLAVMSRNLSYVTENVFMHKFKTAKVCAVQPVTVIVIVDLLRTEQQINYKKVYRRRYESRRSSKPKLH